MNATAPSPTIAPVPSGLHEGVPPTCTRCDAKRRTDPRAFRFPVHKTRRQSVILIAHTRSKINSPRTWSTSRQSTVAVGAPGLRTLSTSGQSSGSPATMSTSCASIARATLPSPRYTPGDRRTTSLLSQRTDDFFCEPILSPGAEPSFGPLLSSASTLAPLNAACSADCKS